MKKPFLLLVLLFSGTFVFAQSPTLCRQVVSNAGGTATSGNLNFEFTVGEAVIETFINANNTFTQGFQQPELGLATRVQEVSDASGLVIFPNPTTGILQIRFAIPSIHFFDLTVIDVAGKQLLSFHSLDGFGTSEVDCSLLPPGTYFLLARNHDGSTFFQAPFIKVTK